jgi:predicted lipoprotein with Yx(FWY)xxD motif
VLTRRTALLLTVLLLGGLVLSATAAGERTGSSARAVVKVAFNKELKASIVVDTTGRTVYMFTDDTKTGRPTCAHVAPSCPKLWPAFTSTGKPLAGKGINARLLGIVRGAGGVPQVTYNRHPLYRFSGDSKPGEVHGQACLGLWYVLSPRGTPIRRGGYPC